MRRTALIFHEHYLWHDAGPHASVIPAGRFVEPGPHAESPERIRRINGLVEVSGLGERLVRTRPRRATRDELLRFHTAEYLDRVRRLSDEGHGEAGVAAPVGAATYDVAVLAAGGCLVAVDAVLDGDADNAYALVRPPGHHALPDTGMGGCIFGNVVLAAAHARHARGIERVAIVDWDAHHGNGTQLAFWDDPSVLTVSLHQDSCFPPSSGTVDEVGGAEATRYQRQRPAPARVGHRCVRGGVRAGRPPSGRPLPAGARPRRGGIRLERLGPARAAHAPQRGVPPADAHPARTRRAARRRSRSSSARRAAMHPRTRPTAAWPSSRSSPASGRRSRTRSFRSSRGTAIRDCSRTRSR